MADRWSALAEGVDCPFDAPRPERNQHWIHIASLSVSSLYLTPNGSYRGYCLLIFDPRHVIQPNELSETEWLTWCSDLYLAQRAIVEFLSPDHINVAALGNELPHLHWHIIPRYRSDPRWGKPVWATRSEEARKAETKLTAGEWEELADGLCRRLKSVTA